MAIKNEHELLSKFIQLFNAYQDGEFGDSGLAERMDVLINAYSPEEKSLPGTLVKAFTAESLEGLENIVNNFISFLTETNYRLMGPVQYSTYKEGALSGITYSALLTYEKRQD